MFKTLFPTLLLFLFTITMAFAGTITGNVHTPGSVPIAGATISVPGYSTTSDSSGNYSLSVPAGSYTVTCSASGYTTQTQPATVPTGIKAQVSFIWTLEPIGIKGNSDSDGVPGGFGGGLLFGFVFTLLWVDVKSTEVRMKRRKVQAVRTA